MQTISSLLHKIGEIALLSVSEIEQCRQSETILFSGLLSQNFSQHAKTTEIRINALQLDLRLISKPGHEYSEIQDPSDRKSSAYSHYRVETNQIFPDFKAKVRDTRTGFLLSIESESLTIH